MEENLKKETDYCSVHNVIFHTSDAGKCFMCENERKNKEFIFQESADFACLVLDYLARFELFFEEPNLLKRDFILAKNITELKLEAEIMLKKINATK